MKLFIAEKPSMARELAKCLPDPHQRGNGCIRTGGGIVTWAYGHVLQQAEPQDYDPKYKRWNAADLPHYGPHRQPRRRYYRQRR